MAGKRKRTAEPDGKKEATEAHRNAELVSKVIASIEAKLAKDELKPTVGDLIRLMQIRQEEQPREITVSWVEPNEKDDALRK